ncbi:MAG: glycerophosphodiester phosphodiesterase [Desulfohalobiaceae bacterium]|nr:glycerophosphodiester phosphodiesterase [Desulfohalobiaceae bacterium]
MPDSVKTLLMKSADSYQALRPQPRPCLERLKSCRLVSHRGEHDGTLILENTLPAFEQAAADRVWGIEFDVTWTRDLQPVVHHDPSLARVFGRNQRIDRLTLAELKAICPLIPTLREVLERFGRRIHLMIELKAGSYTDPERQNAVLQQSLSGLRPGLDYHLLSLNPALFELLPCVSPRTWVFVAEFNIKEVSRLALEKNSKGIAAHYALVSNKYRDRHHGQGQLVGTAYPDSKNCLFREINRGMDWIFSNRAGKLQSVVTAAIQEAPFPADR